MRPRPMVLCLLAYAAKSVGWNVEWHANGITVTEDAPAMERKPRRWRLIAVELP